MRKQSRFEELRRRVAAPVRVEAVVEAEERDSETVLLSADDSVRLHPHQLEQEVHSQLMAEPSLNFTSLVVRRIQDGLCLEGVLEADDENDVSTLVRRICGATQVLNHLVVHSPRRLPRKG